MSHVTVNFDYCEASKQFYYVFKYMLVDIKLLFSKTLVILYKIYVQ